MPTPPLARVAMLAVLKEFGSMTITEMAAETGKLRDAIARVVRDARNAKEIYIKDWERHTTGKRGGTCSPIYTLGNRPDAKPPPRLPDSVYSQRYRERHSAKIRIKRQAEPNPYLQLICRSAPTKQQSAKA
jgi:hypothetical protein